MTWQDGVAAVTLIMRLSFIEDFTETNKCMCDCLHRDKTFVLPGFPTCVVIVPTKSISSTAGDSTSHAATTISTIS